MSVVSDARLFTSLGRQDSNLSVSFGPGPPMSVSAVGTIGFNRRDQSGSSQIYYLDNVYYVPEQNMNLISIITLNTHKCGVNFDQQPGHIRLTNANGECTHACSWENNLPYISVEILDQDDQQPPT